MLHQPEDTHRDKGARRRLVQILREKGIADEVVLSAMEQVPRHLLLDSGFQHLAYQDRAVPILANQTMSMPSTVARQTELLKVVPGLKVLEIGTGSGYQACVLAAMGVELHTIEFHKNLYTHTFAKLVKMGYPINCYVGDGSLGLPDVAPFDRIIVTAGAPLLPDPLLRQLVVGGILVIPVGDNQSQIMMRLTRQSDGTFIREDFGDFKFVPLRGAKGWG